MRAADRRTIVLLAAVTAFAAALRLVAIDAKGFWGDEISTVFLLHRPYGDMLDHVARLESTPPLYYSLAWLWAKLFGTTEAGLRSLSALVGAGTVPLAYGAAQELVSRRGALYAATLAAASPVLVWYSDEARAYMLLVFLGAGALWCFARTLKSSSRLALALWAAASSLAVLTHYFAVFLAIPEAAVLLRRCAVRREAIAAVATVGAACAAIFPLANQAKLVVIPQLGQGNPVRARNWQPANPMCSCVPTPVGLGVSLAATTKTAKHATPMDSPRKRPATETLAGPRRGA